jgi:hypothetical protein
LYLVLIHSHSWVWGLNLLAWGVQGILMGVWIGCQYEASKKNEDTRGEDPQFMGWVCKPIWLVRYIPYPLVN